MVPQKFPKVKNQKPDGDDWCSARYGQNKHKDRLRVRSDSMKGSSVGSLMDNINLQTHDP
jgi:hypothetical protein